MKETSASKTLVLFDFDGTITTADSFPLFFKYTFGNTRFLTGFMLYSLHFVLYKLKLLSGEKFKTSILSFYLKTKKRNWIEEKGMEFINAISTNKIIKPGFIEKIQNYKAAGATVAVVSASADAWIKPFCQKHDLICICTELKYTDELFTGKLNTKNCNNREKKIRVEHRFDLSSFDEIIAYGDSKGDEQLMELSTVKYWIK